MNLLLYISLAVTTNILGQITHSETVTIESSSYGPKLILNDANTANKVPLEFRSSNVIKWELGARNANEQHDLALWRHNNGTYHDVMWFNQDNGNVGIGSKTPNSKLVIQDLTKDQLSLINTTSNSWQLRAGSTGSLIFKDDGVERIRINSSGNMGIGTNSPQGKLHVSTGTSGDAIFRLEADTDNNNESDNPLIEIRQDGGQLGVNIGYSEENFGGNIFGIGTRYTNQESWDTFTINTSNGNVGIGTKNADSWKLAVKGKIRAEEIKVETGWADYVFKEGYDLPTLEEVEKHIMEKGHLINIPSAKEVEANGILLGEMNRLLLEKIEELTLYTLQQDNAIKELSSLREENKLLYKKLHSLEAVILKILEKQN
ncbi:hypothetical protein [Maribacter sp. 2304DJ31-5]|uniref:hypothetical protein n=1 Tax=Maribacter sp. 2304DJ31-5 TaxID=3386273 RepID=UPI0039BC326A